MEYGLIGEKLGHSYSPLIHSFLGDYRYELTECTPETLDALLKSRAFKGANVTIPYKKTVMPYCDRLTDIAEEIGCVNTLVHRGGELVGHNTDIFGFTVMLQKAGIDPSGRKCCILGGGATSLTARTALTHMGAKEIVTVSRKGPVTYDELYARHADCEVLVNCTPVGMYPKNGVSAVDLSRLTNLIAVADVVYNPERTALILDAMERGIRCTSGLTMLVGQAHEAAEWFTGEKIAPAVDDEICACLRCDTLNLILIGMPGCGKTSIGRRVAEKLGRPFVCCDEEIVRRAEMPIPEIFRMHGEAYFRNLEEEVVKDVCKEKGRVIATGGGAILRRANVRAMRQNGRVIWLKRSIDALPRDGRPLSSSHEALLKLWDARKDLYRAASDCVVENDGAMNETVNQAMEGFYEAARH